MRIRGAKHGDMENELFHWLCHAQKNTTAVGGRTVNMKDDELALTMGTDFKCPMAGSSSSKDGSQ